MKYIFNTNVIYCTLSTELGMSNYVGIVLNVQEMDVEISTIHNYSELRM